MGLCLKSVAHSRVSDLERKEEIEKGPARAPSSRERPSHAANIARNLLSAENITKSDEHLGRPKLPEPPLGGGQGLGRLTQVLHRLSRRHLQTQTSKMAMSIHVHPCPNDLKP